MFLPVPINTFRNSGWRPAPSRSLAAARPCGIGMYNSRLITASGSIYGSHLVYKKKCWPDFFYFWQVTASGFISCDRVHACLASRNSSFFSSSVVQRWIVSAQNIFLNLAMQHTLWSPSTALRQWALCKWIALDVQSISSLQKHKLPLDLT